MITGVNPLLDAQEKDDLDLARELFFKDPSLAISGKGGARGKTPIHYAAHEEKIEFLKLYLESGVLDKLKAVNVRSEFGLTPLHCAATALDSCEVLDYLRRAGADFHATDRTGKKPIDYAFPSSMTSAPIEEWLSEHTFPSLFFLAAQKLLQLSKREEMLPPEEVYLSAKMLIAQEEEKKEKTERHETYLKSLPRRIGYWPL